MFLLQKSRKAALSWSLLDSEETRLSSPALDTDRFSDSESLEEALSAAAALSLKLTEEVSAVAAAAAAAACAVGVTETRPWLTVKKSGEPDSELPAPRMPLPMPEKSRMSGSSLSTTAARG